MRLSGWHVPIEYLSASALTQFVQCPEQFRLRRIQKIPESVGVEKFIGIVDHATHASNFRHKIDTGVDLTTDMMDRLYGAHWEETAITEGEPEWFEDEQASTLEHGKQIMRVYHEQITPTVHPVEVEKRFEEQLPGVPVPVVGYIDLEEHRRVIERKTVKSKLKKPKTKWILQGRIYNLAFDKPVEWHIVTRARDPQAVTPQLEPGLRLSGVNHDATVTIVQQAAELLNDLYLRYGPDRPWPTNGVFHDWMCSYCGFGPRYGKQCHLWRDHADTHESQPLPADSGSDLLRHSSPAGA